MKNITINIFLVLIIGCFNKTISQDFWELINFPDTTSINSIFVNDQQEIFIGSGSGVYKSNGESSVWEFLGLENRIVHSIAINNNGDIYAGTSQSPQAEGLFRSCDNGLTWESILPDIGVYGNIVALMVSGDTLFASLWMGGAALIRSYDNGQTWDLVFSTNNTSEYVSDITSSTSNIIFISLEAFLANMGGVYKSNDGGDSWEFIGLFNHSISSLALNSYGDLFAGSSGGLVDTASAGLFVLREGEQGWDSLLSGPQIADIAINDLDHIYFCGSWPNGVVRSIDNGENFELINDGLPEGIMRNLFIDTYDFIYVINLTTLAKSINPTVSVIEKFPVPSFNNWLIYPNPVNNVLHIKPTNKYLEIEINSIAIYNSFGTLIKSHNNLLSINYSIDVSDLPRGIYFIEISGYKYRNQTKFIIN